jgi:glycogen operon protein
MTEDDWETGLGRAVMLFLNGDGIRETGPRGDRITDDSFLLCFNSYWEPVTFALPATEYGAKWRVVLDTAVPTSRAERVREQADDGDAEVAEAGGKIRVDARSLVVVIRTV